MGVGIEALGVFGIRANPGHGEHAIAPRALFLLHQLTREREGLVLLGVGRGGTIVGAVEAVDILDARRRRRRRRPPWASSKESPGCAAGSASGNCMR